jgi:TPR repeat protein
MTVRLLFPVAVAFTSAVILAASDLEAGKRAYDKGDYAMALRELLPLADRDNAQAMYLVGSMLFEGKGVKQNKRSGLALFHFAADAGFAEAELRLAAMYMAGDSVAKNIDNSIYYSRRAAEHGHPIGQFAMGSFYSAGVHETHDSVTELKQDRVVAYMWFSLCAAEKLCDDARKELAKEMTPRQILDAQKATEQWKSQHNQVRPK